MKRKIFIRTVSVLIAIWMILLAIVYLTNIKYRDHIISYLKLYVDQYLQTEILIQKDNLKFTVFKKFPYVSVDLYDILVKSVEGPDYSQFSIKQEDTLIFAGRLSFIFNLMSILSQKYELNKIEIKDAVINVLTDQEGMSNYNILKPQLKVKKKDGFTINLRKILLKSVTVNYIDARISGNFGGFIENAMFSGSFSADNLFLRLQLNAEQCHVKLDKTNYLQNQTLSFKAEIQKKDQLFTLRKGDFNLSGLKMIANGEWNQSKKYYSLVVESRSVSLQQLKQPIIQSLLNNAIFTPEGGLLNLKTSISGYLNGNNPLISAEFEVSKGKFFNKKGDIRFEDVYTHGFFTNGKNHNASTTRFEIDSLSAFSGRSEVFLTLTLENLNSPILLGQLKSKFELERLSAIETPKQRFELSGLATAIFFFKGILPPLNTFRLSDLNKLALQGEIRFENIYIKSLVNPLPPATVSGKITIKSLQEIDLKQICVKTGNSSLMIDGTVTNFPVFEKDSLFVPIYRCNVESPEFYVEDFLLKENKTSTEITKAAFPDSIIVFANFHAQKFMFGKFEASNVSGEIHYQPKTLLISNFSMNSQKGTINSKINISQKEGLFITHCEANLQRINISNMFYSFNNFGQTVISSENLGGTISGTVKVTAAWDQLLNPLIDSIYLESEIEINQGEIINYQPLMGLSRFIEVEELKHIRFDRLYTFINIHQKTVFISQTDIHSSAISLTGSGEHYFDNSYIYHLQVQLSNILWKKAKKKKPENTEFGYIADDGLGRTTLPLAIKGKDTDFNVIYDKKTARNSFREKVIKEKNELHNLFAPSEASVNALEDNQNNNVMQIEWHEDTANIKSPKQENKNKEKPQEYSIEWKDE